MEDGNRSEQDMEAIAERTQGVSDYSDDDAAEAFVIYKQVRPDMRNQKTGRGFKPGPRPPVQEMTGAFRAKMISDLKAKTKCRACGKVGHWKRECPSANKSKNTPGKPGSSAVARTPWKCTTSVAKRTWTTTSTSQKETFSTRKPSSWTSTSQRRTRTTRTTRTMCATRALQTPVPKAIGSASMRRKGDAWRS
ncbi:unnamed protein product [Polarella glacialis]|uniref:CCHC-type domain-containing protein n=1 Tax=Polarella glacialis TaxID=89957 RepID=A0A813FG73_POLGL|nr:unnamed protein product [Polarella glacialis]